MARVVASGGFESFDVYPSNNETALLAPWLAHFNRVYAKVQRMSGMNNKVDRVEVCLNGKLITKFRKKKVEYIARFGHEDDINHRLLFHGTPKAKNLQSIVKGGFLLSKLGSNTKNTGLYGAGIYFSEHTDTSKLYSQGVGSMLVCEVLIGKPYQAPLKSGAKLHKPHIYTSHVSDAKCQEVVIYDMDAILPQYIVHFTKQKRGAPGSQEALVGLGGGGGGGGFGMPAGMGMGMVPGMGMMPGILPGGGGSSRVPAFGGAGRTLGSVGGGGKTKRRKKSK